MKFQKKICLIVDAFSTGKYLAPALRSHGYQCIHIISSKMLPPSLANSYKREDFINTVVFDNNLEKIIEELKDYQIKLCIAGSESGVELADILSEKLNLISNGSQFSQARRNKYLMYKAVSNCGLKTADYFKSDQLDELITWIETNKTWPMVIKPIDSASGDNVSICNSLDEVKDSFKKIMSSTNIFGSQNKEVLCQSFIDGTEFIVNTVSWEGRHNIVEVWQVNRIPNTTIYDTCELITPEHQYFNALKEYGFKVLDALKIFYGAATTELKYSSAGPILIESASRLMGAAELSITNEVFGFNQVSLTVDAYLDPINFQKKLDVGITRANKHAMAILLISAVDGKLKQDLNFDTVFKKLSTLHSYEIDVKSEDILSKTTGLLTCPGTVYLLGEKEQVLKEAKLIRDEEQAIYQAALASLPFREKNNLSVSINNSSTRFLNFFKSINKDTDVKNTINDLLTLPGIAKLIYGNQDTLTSTFKRYYSRYLFELLGKGLIFTSTTTTVEESMQMLRKNLFNALLCIEILSLSSNKDVKFVSHDDTLRYGRK